MSDLIQTPVSVVAKPEPRAVVRQNFAKGIDALRREYETLVEKHGAAVAVGDQPEASKTKAAKKAAFAVWHEAVMAQQHEAREAKRR